MMSSSVLTASCDVLVMQAKAAKQKLSTRRPASAAARGKGSGPAPSRRGRGRGGVSLGVLLEEGLLLPGTGVLSVDYKQRRTLADLCGDGRIKCACAPSPDLTSLKRLRFRPSNCW